MNSNEIYSEEIQNSAPVFVYTDRDHIEHVIGLGVMTERCGKDKSHANICFAFLPTYISSLETQTLQHKTLQNEKPAELKFDIDKIFKMFKPLIELFQTSIESNST